MRNLAKSVAELQSENVSFELECIDRMYLNLYVPQLSSAAGVASYFRHYKGQRFASTKDALAMSERFWSSPENVDAASAEGLLVSLDGDFRFENGY
jgi:hypothetical protein